MLISHSPAIGETTTVCALGHRKTSYECPACSEARTGVLCPVEHWRWYRGRTSSERIKALIDQKLGRTSPGAGGDERGGGLREVLRRVVMDYGDKCCSDPEGCACSMAQAIRLVNWGR